MTRPHRTRSLGEKPSRRRAVRHPDAASAGTSRSPAPTLAAFVDAVVWIKRAAALTHKETGRLEAPLADAILRAADEVLRPASRSVHRGRVPAGAGTSHNMNVNEVLANGPRAHWGSRARATPGAPERSREHGPEHNDVIPTAMRLAVLAPLPSTSPRSTRWPRRSSAGRGVRRHNQVGPAHLQTRRRPAGQEFTAYGTPSSATVRSWRSGGLAAGDEHRRHRGRNCSTPRPAYPGLMVNYLRQVSGLELREGQTGSS